MFRRCIVDVAWQCVSVCQGRWFGVSVNPGGLRGVQVPAIRLQAGDAAHPL